jgi:hypothetical protein
LGIGGILNSGVRIKIRSRSRDLAFHGRVSAEGLLASEGQGFGDGGGAGSRSGRAA